MLYKYLLTVVCGLCLLDSLEANKHSCKDVEACGDRGVCPKSQSQDTFIKTACNCHGNFTGQFCQFVDDRYEIRSNAPDKPLVLTDTNAPSYRKDFRLLFRRVKNPPDAKVLYYLLRFKDTGDSDSKWQTKTIAASYNRKKLKIVLETLEWNREYALELYAGNKFGLGVPDRSTVKRPEVTEPKIDSSSPDQTIRSGSDLKLECAASGTPTPEYRWLFNDQELDEVNAVKTRDGQLLIPNVSSQRHQGEYRCVVTNMWGKVLGRPIKVEIRDPAKFKSESNSWEAKNVSITMHIGKGFLIECPDHTPTIGRAIKWSALTAEGVPIDFPTSPRVWVTQTGGLYFSKVLQEDFDFFQKYKGIRCNLGNSSFHPFEGSNLHVVAVKNFTQQTKKKLKFRFFEKPKDIRVFTGSFAEFYCYAQSSGTNLYSWKKGKHPLYPNEKYELLDFNRVLRIKDVNKEDVGSYTCETVFIYEKISQGIKKQYYSNALHAKAKLTLAEVAYVTNTPLTVYRGTTLVMNCGKKSDKVTFYYDGHLIKDEPVYGSKFGFEEIDFDIYPNRVQVVEIEPSATGVYQCDVKTMHGYVTKTQYIHVRDYHPMEWPCSAAVENNLLCLIKGSTATLNCASSQGMTTKWENLPTDADNRFRKLSNGLLEISDVRDSDSNADITCKFSSKDTPISGTGHIQTFVPNTVDGAWSAWSNFGACSRTCGEGVMLRTRSCNNPAPQHGGKECEGESQDTTSCELLACPVTSGQGSVVQTRLCTNPAPKHGEMKCEGKSYLTTQSIGPPCPVDGSWSVWSEFGACSGRCGEGVMLRTRSCNNPAPQHGGKECEGESQDTTSCEMLACPVDGAWSVWSEFGPCSATCGTGVMQSTRSCNNPAPLYGGKECEGESQYSTPCELPTCPVHGGWASWSSWTDCSSLCGSGIISRFRACTNPSPAYGGQECLGRVLEERPCEKQPCKVNGGWTEWSEWSPCSVTCDSGHKTRTRNCSNPIPLHGGNNCHGKPVFQMECNIKPCDRGDPDSDVVVIERKSSGLNVFLLAITISLLSICIIVGGCYFLRASEAESTNYIPMTVAKSAGREKRVSYATSPGPKSNRPALPKRDYDKQSSYEPLREVVSGYESPVDSHDLGKEKLRISKISHNLVKGLFQPKQDPKGEKKVRMAISIDSEKVKVKAKDGTLPSKITLGKGDGEKIVLKNVKYVSPKTSESPSGKSSSGSRTSIRKGRVSFSEPEKTEEPPAPDAMTKNKSNSPLKSAITRATTSKPEASPDARRKLSDTPQKKSPAIPPKPPATPPKPEALPPAPSKSAASSKKPPATPPKPETLAVAPSKSPATPPKKSPATPPKPKALAAASSKSPATPPKKSPATPPKKSPAVPPKPGALPTAPALPPKPAASPAAPPESPATPPKSSGIPAPPALPPIGSPSTYVRASTSSKSSRASESTSKSSCASSSASSIPFSASDLLNVKLKSAKLPRPKSSTSAGLSSDQSSGGAHITGADIRSVKLKSVKRRESKIEESSSTKGPAWLADIGKVKLKSVKRRESSTSQDPAVAAYEKLSPVERVFYDSPVMGSFIRSKTSDIPKKPPKSRPSLYASDAGMTSDTEYEYESSGNESN